MTGANFKTSILNFVFTAFQALSAQLSVTSRHTVLIRFPMSRLNVYFSCEIYIFGKAGYYTSYNCLVCTVCGIFPYRATTRDLAQHPIYFPHSTFTPVNYTIIQTVTLQSVHIKRGNSLIFNNSNLMLTII